MILRSTDIQGSLRARRGQPLSRKKQRGFITINPYGFTYGAVDPNYSNRTFIFHPGGTNGSTTFTDTSSNALTGTRIGASAQILTNANNTFVAGTSFRFYQGAAHAVRFDKPSGHFITSDIWQFEFNIEMVQMSTGTASGQDNNCVMKFGDANTVQNGFYFSINSAGTMVFAGQTISGNQFTANTRRRVRLVNDASGFSLYVDGSRVYNGSQYTSMDNVFTKLWIGSDTFSVGNNQYSCGGLIDEVRVTSGHVDNASTATTYTLPTAAFPDS